MYTASRSPSSADEGVPSLPTTLPAAQLQRTCTFVPLRMPLLGQMTTTGLNPSSSSRFTLSIPPLGRPGAVGECAWEGRGERWVVLC